MIRDGCAGPAARPSGRGRRRQNGSIRATIRAIRPSQSSESLIRVVHPSRLSGRARLRGGRSPPGRVRPGPAAPAPPLPGDLGGPAPRGGGAGGVQGQTRPLGYGPERRADVFDFEGAHRQRPTDRDFSLNTQANWIRTREATAALAVRLCREVRRSDPAVSKRAERLAACYERLLPACIASIEVLSRFAGQTPLSTNGPNALAACHERLSRSCSLSRALLQLVLSLAVCWPATQAVRTRAAPAARFAGNKAHQGASIP